MAVFLSGLRVGKGTREQRNCVPPKQYFAGAGTGTSRVLFDMLPRGDRSGMTTRDEYLKFAEECFRLAQQTADPDARARLLDMAQAWRDLADKVQNPPAK
jgi:hypothetical protein